MRHEEVPVLQEDSCWGGGAVKTAAAAMGSDRRRNMDGQSKAITIVRSMRGDRRMTPKLNGEVVSKNTPYSDHSSQKGKEEKGKGSCLVKY